jgi:hypothetical protein
LRGDGPLSESSSDEATASAPNIGASGLAFPLAGGFFGELSQLALAAPPSLPCGLPVGISKRPVVGAAARRADLAGGESQLLFAAGVVFFAG